jgi:hypothetical protein
MKFSRVRARTVRRVALAVLRLREQDLKPQTIGSAMKPVRRAGRNELTRFATEAQAPTGLLPFVTTRSVRFAPAFFGEVDSQRGPAS